MSRIPFKITLHFDSYFVILDVILITNNRDYFSSLRTANAPDELPMLPAEGRVGTCFYSVSAPYLMAAGRWPSLPVVPETSLPVVGPNNEWSRSMDEIGQNYVSFFYTRSYSYPLHCLLLRNGTMPHCRTLLNTTVSDIVRPQRKVLNEKVRWILENHRPQPLPEAVQSRISDIL